MATKTKRQVSRKNLVQDEGGRGKGKNALVPFKNKNASGHLSTYVRKGDDAIDVNINIPAFAKNWEKIASDFPPVFVHEKIGDYVAGIYTGMKEVKTDNGDSKLYLIDTGDSQTPQVAVWGKTVLNNLMDKIEPGTAILIQLVRFSPSKFGNDAYIFEVMTPKKK